MAKKTEKLPDTEATPIEGIEESDYEAAFDEASDTVPVDELDSGSATTVVTETPPKTDPDEVTPPEGDVTPPEGDVTPPDQTPAPTAAEIALTSRVAELEGQLAEKTKPDATPTTTPEPTPPAELSAEDQEAIDEVKEDWPTIHRTMEIQISQLEQRLAAVIDQKLGAVQQVLQPVVKHTQETAQDKFMLAIEKAHPGAKALLPQVESWIATQPSYAQAAMNNVLDRGNSLQVVELLDQWKKETKFVDETGDTTVVTDTDDRLSRMEGVRTERTSVTTDDDPSDFDSAFEKAANT